MQILDLKATNFVSGGGAISQNFSEHEKDIFHYGITVQASFDLLATAAIGTLAALLSPQAALVVTATTAASMGLMLLNGLTIADWGVGNKLHQYYKK